MPDLIELPEEVLDNIASLVSSSSELQCLSLCSSTLNRIAAPHLYRNLTLVHQNQPGLRNFEKLFAISQYVWRYPNRLKHIKKLTLRWDWGARTIDPFQYEIAEQKLKHLLVYDQPPKKTTVSDDYHYLQNMVFKFSMNADDNSCITNLEEVLVLKLLQKLRNLCSLDVFPQSRNRWIHLYRGSESMWSGGMVAIDPLQDHPNLCSLEEVAIGMDPRYESIIHYSYKMYFQFPKIKKIILHGIRRKVSRQEFISFRVYQPVERYDHLYQQYLELPKVPVNSPVRHLELQRCDLPWRTVCNIIGYCSSLYTFVMRNERLVGAYLPNVLRSLQSHADTLRNLGFGFRRGRYSDHVGNPIHGLDFSSFRQLEHLEINVTMLTGARSRRKDLSTDPIDHTDIRKRLPNRLQSLGLVVLEPYSEGAEEIYSLKRYVSQMTCRKRGDWPHLKQISLITCYSPDVESPIRDAFIAIEDGGDVALKVYYSAWMRQDPRMGTKYETIWEALPNNWANNQELVPLEK